MPKSDRELILDTYKPLGTNPDGPSSLIHGDKIHSTQKTSSFLTTLAGWFSGADPVKSDLCLRIAEKAWEILNNQTELNAPDDIVSRHFDLSGAMKVFYRYRDREDYYERAIECARLQISMQEAAMQGLRYQTEARNQFRRKMENEHSIPDMGHEEFRAPGHAGYKQLAIILEKEKRFEEALDLVLEAGTAGWDGDWVKRQERLRKKIEKANQK